MDAAGECAGGLAGRVTVYTTLGCPHCQRAKSRLRGLGLPFCEVDLSRHAALAQRIRKLTGGRTAPQIFFNSVHVGSSDDLQKLAPEELQRLVRMVREEPVPLDAPPIPGEENQRKRGILSDGETDSPFKNQQVCFCGLALELKRSCGIGHHRRGLKVCRDSFSGRQLMDGLAREKGLDKHCALYKISIMIYQQYSSGVTFFDQTKNASLVNMLKRVHQQNHSYLANVDKRSSGHCSPRCTAELSEELRRTILKLYADHLSADGKFVDYKAMSRSPIFEKYCELTIQLQRVELQSLSREEKLAFFINVYNALVIHGHIRMGSPQNMWQRYRFFNYVSYLIGGAVFTLQDIENGVLRGNRKGVAQLMKPFSLSDPRFQVALPDPEPLVHFALNCGAKGCPPIKTYTAKDIASQLRTAAEAFLENDEGCKVDPLRGEVHLSQIFKWYKVDFGDTDEKLLKWVLNHMGDSPKKSSLEALLKAPCYKVIYMPYNWSTNGMG
uniref:Zgc:152951 n=1 Tax=Lepisosteus oculatus TaxID=7918 RepID=W5MWX0_LEPOC